MLIKTHIKHAAFRVKNKNLDQVIQELKANLDNIYTAEQASTLILRAFEAAAILEQQQSANIDQLITTSLANHEYNN